MAALFASLDATAQAELVRRGEVTARELVDSAVEAIERLNPEIRAVIHPAFMIARDAAQLAGDSGPLAGVPILMKDFGGEEAGRPNHMGMRLAKQLGHVEPVDSFLTSKLKQAGCISLGRTNTPELAILPITESDAYGTTGNPWSPTHSPGGSSGGSAAAVAAGFVAAAHASDGGGSLRIPASMCGLVGLKPTRARTSLSPNLGEGWSGLSCAFMLTRSVRDCAAFLDALAGPATGDPYYAPPPSGPYRDHVGSDPGPLRIALLDHGIRGIDVHPECAEAAISTAKALEELGHEIVPTYPSVLDATEYVRHFAVVVSGNVACVLDSWEARLGRPITDGDVEPLTWALTQWGRRITAPQFVQAQQSIHRFSRTLAGFWQDYDLLLTPTLAQLPPELGALMPGAREPMSDYTKTAPYGVFTLPFNLSGQPAISLPTHMSQDGLPIGTQLVAAAGREDVLLQVASQLERAVPWAGRRPELFG